MDDLALKVTRRDSLEQYCDEPEDPRPDDDVLPLFVDSRPSISAASGKNVVKVVLTGGPCGGKSTAQAALKEFFTNLGWRVYCVPEAATVLLGGGVKFADLSADQILAFQDSILKTMFTFEQAYMRLALLDGKADQNVMLICDRGAMDASAYMDPMDWARILKATGFNEVELRDTRYDLVIHLVTAADGAEAFYTLSNNDTRSEGIELAREWDKKCMQAWVGHPYLEVVDNRSDFAEKVNRVLRLVCKRFGVENNADTLSSGRVKRKFLLASDAFDIPVKHEVFTVVHEYLLTSDGSQVRIRRRGQNGNYGFSETVRQVLPDGSKVETRRILTSRQYMALQRQADPRRYPVRKTRVNFLYEQRYFQIDRFEEPCHPRCVGVVLLETYDAKEDVSTLRLPPFITAVKEVTHDKQYSMYHLSLKDD